MDPLVSIVMPCRDDRDFIVESISSVIGQSLTDWELIVVDDGSSDGTVELIDRLISQDSRVHKLSTSGGQGPARARNLGVEAASGRYVAFLDSDDVWSTWKLELQINYMRDSGSPFTYTKFHLIDANGSTFRDALPLPRRVNRRKLLRYCFVRMSSVVVDQAASGKVFFPDLMKRQDFAFFLSVLRRVPFGHLVDADLCAYRVRKNSVSSVKYKNIQYQWAVYRKVEKLPVVECLFYMLAWFVRAGLVHSVRVMAQRISVGAAVKRVSM